MRDENSVKKTIHVGDRASLTKRFTVEDIEAFAQVSMDDQGLHTDPEFSRRGLFRRPVVHGVLVGSLISSVMGTRLPGEGTVLQSEDIRFLQPVYPGDTVTAEVVVTGIEEHDKYYIATLEGVCRNQDDITVVEADCRQLMLKRLFEAG